MRLRLYAVAWTLWLAAAACGGPNSPAYTDGAFAAKPAMPGVLIVDTQCGDLTACRAACKDSSWAACTRAGDLLWATNSAAAERHWLRGCKAGHGIACERLMQVSGLKPRLSDRYAGHACAYGQPKACGMLGRSMAVRAMVVTDRARQRHLLLEAAAMFEAACGDQDWYACWNAASIYQSTGKIGTRSVESLAGAARGRAYGACNDGDPTACLFLGQREQALGHAESARRMYVRSCGLSKAHAPDAPTKRATFPSVFCSGVRDEASIAPIPVPKDSRWVSLRARKGRRRFLSGVRFPRPADETKYDMMKRGVRTIATAVAICISPLGTIESIQLIDPGPSPEWNRAIFYAVRTWRYTPADSETSVCATVLLTYSQR